SFYAQKLFNTYKGNEVVPIEGGGIPVRDRPLTRADSAAGRTQPRQIPVLFYVATRDRATGTIYLKVVNAAGEPQAVKIGLTGVGKVVAAGQQIVLKGNGPEETNSITEPEKIVPVASKVT